MEIQNIRARLPDDILRYIAQWHRHAYYLQRLGGQLRSWLERVRKKAREARLRDILVLMELDHVMGIRPQGEDYDKARSYWVGRRRAGFYTWMDDT